MLLSGQHIESLDFYKRSDPPSYEASIARQTRRILLLHLRIKTPFVSFLSSATSLLPNHLRLFPIPARTCSLLLRFHRTRGHPDLA